MKSVLSKNKFVVLFLITVLNLSPVLAKAAAAASKKQNNSQASAILKKYKINPADVSIQIYNAHNEILTLNEKSKKIPASISKLLTSLAVLKRFPAGHKFYTRLFYDGKNLYLKGGGDPSFVSESMWFLVNEFTRAGVKDIKGDIIVDDSLFDEVRYDESRESTRVDRAYDSPVGAMSFNWNAVNIFVKPSSLGQKARVVVDPDNSYFDLVNNTTTVASPKKDLVATISNENRLITVSGDVAQNAPEKGIFKSIENPSVWSGENLKFFLAQRNIKLSGKVKTGLVPADAELVATSESKNMAHIMADMNKFSNNYVAEMLTKGISALETDKKASLSRGVEIIREELKKIGLSESEVIVKNPSGLTRDNSFSAFAMNKVLLEIKDDFSVYSTLVESLPIAGIDGTLKRRFKNTKGEGWVRAKTGYLSGVVTLAGYAGRRNGDVLTFSFLYNGPREEAIVREAFDQILLNSLQ